MDSGENALLLLLSQFVSDAEIALSNNCPGSLRKLKPILKCIVESLLNVDLKPGDDEALALAQRLCQVVLVKGQECASIIPLELISSTGKILPALLGSVSDTQQVEGVTASLQSALHSAVARITEEEEDGDAADVVRKAAAIAKVALRCRRQIGREELTDVSTDILLTESIVSRLFEDSTSHKHGHALCFVVSQLAEADPQVISNVIRLAKVDGKSTEINQKCLSLICAVHDQLFTKSHEEYFLSDDFWKCVQLGLTDADNLARKRGLFLAKRCLDYVFKTYNDSSATPYNCSRLVSFAMGRMDDVKALWDDLLLVFDCAEEKQVHMVRQIDRRVRHLSRHCSDQISSSRPIHVSWLTVVYQQLLAHENPAVQKWALLHFLDTCDQSAAAVTRFITGPLLSALNSSKAFGREESPTLEARFQNFLARTTRDLDSAALTTFWNNLLLSVMDQSWGPVPLFYTVQTLHSLAPSSIILPWSLVGKAIRFASSGVQFLDSLPRCAVQTFILELVFRCSVAPRAFEAADLLCAFSGKSQILFFGTRLWTLASDWLRKASDRDEQPETAQDRTVSMLKTVESSHGVQQQLRVSQALALQLALSCGSAPALANSDVVSVLHREVEECLLRPYGSARLQAALLLLMAIDSLAERPRKKRGKPALVYGSDLDVFLIDLPPWARPIMNEVALRGLVRLVQEASSMEDLNMLLHQVLKAAVKCGSKTLDHLTERAVKKLFVATGEDQTPSESLDIVVASLALGFVVEQTGKLPASAPPILQQLKLDQFHLRFPEISLAASSNLSAIRTVESLHNQQASRTIAALFSRQQWIVLSAVLSDSNGGAFEASEVLDLAVEALQVEPAECFFHIVSCVRKVTKTLLLDRRKDDVIEKLKGFLGQCKLALTEQRKSESFWASLGAFCDLCFEPSILSSARLDHELAAIGQDLLDESQSIPGIAVSLSMSLGSGAMNSERLPAQFLPILAKLLVFGPVHKKDSLLLAHANRTIMDMGGDVPANMLEGSDEALATAVRMSALGAVLRLLSHKQIAVGDVVNVLREEDKVVTGGKTRHYENSAVHLTRHRLLQCLLLVTDVCEGSEADRILLFEEAARFLSEEAQQLSVRYLAEWILVVLCARCAACQRLLSQEMARAVEARTGVVACFLVVVTHVALLSSPVEREAELRRALDVVSPWCLSQQFAIRLCALQCFRKLFEAAVAVDSDSAFRQRYGFMLECLDVSLEQGKNTAKLGEDFYLSVFHPYEQLNLTDLFVDFPRLCGLPLAEYNGGHILANLAKECSLIELKNNNQKGLGAHIPSQTVTRLCWCIPCCKMRKKCSGGEGDRAVDAHEDDIVQKKPTPWNSMLVATEDTLSVDSEKSPSFPDLMVVASLIERLPNLGGLCRTCEILGVGTYVIGNKKYCEATEFRNTSVTAHKWVPIEEVRAFELAAFLAEKRDEGYRIVAVEQTSHSVSLQRYTFPSKTVLLLGNESEGIPAALFQLVDDCVEIPQQGVIRSFNVHVTGALVLWEYVRQFTS